MNTKYAMSQMDQDNLVYVRAIDASELPEDVQEELQGLKTVYAVCNAEGDQIALVKERDMAFVLARQNDLAPVTVH